MPRVTVSLDKGWSQTPDERSGTPRIARLVNARVEVPGRIAKSHGTKLVGTAAFPSSASLTKPLAFGTVPGADTFALCRRAGASCNGLTAMSGRMSASNTTWVISAGNPGVAYDEAPRVRSIFTDPSYSYETPGLLDLAATSRDVIVVATGLQDWSGTMQGTFNYADIQWALVSVHDLQVKATGALALQLATGVRPFMVVSGRFLVCYKAANTLGIYEFREGTTLGLAEVTTLTTVVTVGQNTNLDASYDATLGRLLVVSASGEYWLLNTTTWAVTQSGTLGISTQMGTLGISVKSTVTTGLTYAVWRTGTTDWQYAVFRILDGSFTTVKAAATLYQSPIAVPNCGVLTYRAAVSAWGNATWNVPEGAFAAIYAEQYATDAQYITGVVRAFTSSGTMSTASCGFEMSGAYPASKPVVVADDSSPSGVINPNCRLWAYMSGERAVRSAICLGQGPETYLESQQTKLRPRLLGMAFRGGDPTVTLREGVVNCVNGSVRANDMLPPLTGTVGRSGWLTAIVAQKAAGGIGPYSYNDATNVYLVSQVDGESLLTSEPPDVLQMAASRGNAVSISTAVPSCYTNRVDMDGAQYPPRNPAAEYIGGGTYPAAGTYQYLVVREWRDGNGALYRSPPSDPVSITHSAGKMRITYWDDCWQPGMLNTVTKIYRTKESGTVFYLTSPAQGVPTAGSTNAGLTWDDTNADGYIASQEILYTQGARGGASGLLEHWGCPPCRTIWSGADRMIAGGLENQNRVRWSNLFYAGEGVSWPEHGAFAMDMPEPVTAVACLDGVWIVFGARTTNLITGAGPDAFGVGQFDSAKLISSTVGAIKWRSVVECELGILFQAGDGQIYAVQRGTYQVVPMSAAIRDSIAGTAPSSLDLAVDVGDTEEPWNWIEAAIFDPMAHEVHFLEHWGGRRWVLQTDVGSWRAELSEYMADRIPIHAGNILERLTDHSIVMDYAGPVFVAYGLTDGIPIATRLARKYDFETFRDAGSNARRWCLRTSDIDLVDGRIRRVWARMHRLLDSRETGAYTEGYGARVGLSFDGKPLDQALDELQILPFDPDLPTNRFVDLEVCPARQRCNQVRIWLGDFITGDNMDLSWYLVDLSLELESNVRGRGPIRRAPGQARSY